MLNICHKRKLLFIHITKCAGKSVEHAVFGHKVGIKSDHKTVRDFNNYILNEYFSFAIVRNPWDRYISQLLFDAKNPANGRKLDKLKQHLADDMNPKNIDKVCSYRESLTLDDEHIVVNEVLRFENLEEEWKKVAEITGVSHLPVLNVNKNKKHYSTYYNEETKNMLAEYWKWDIEKFDYKFEEEPTRKEEKNHE